MSRWARWMMVSSSVPSWRHAVAISQATTPPPRMASRRGARLALVASRLVHGRAAASPGVGGIAARLPVHTATARRAVSSTVVPPSPVTVTRRSPARRPWPRRRAIPFFSSHFTWPASSQWAANRSRLASTAGTSGGPVQDARAPATARASANACSGRSNALLGMQAQKEHSPPTSSRSTTTTLRPPLAARCARFSPVGPAPITTTSYCGAGMASSPRSTPSRPGARPARREAVACVGLDG